MAKKINLETHCLWTQQEAFGDWYSTTCENEFVLNDGSPKENGMRFCLFCGKKLNEELVIND